MKMCKIRDFSGIPDFQWNAPQKHQGIVTFIKGSGVGPGEARFAQKPWRSTKCMPLQQKTRRTYRLSCFHEDLVLFASSARNHGIPIGLLRFLRCHFLQNHHLHGNHDFLWKSRISTKIAGFHRKPRFSRKCWFRRKARLENTKKRLRLSRVLAPAAGEVGFSRKTWKSRKSGENGRKTQKSWNSARNARKQKTAEMGKLRIPGNRGPPARPPLADRRISNRENIRRDFLEIRHAFVAKRPKCAPFSIQILDKRQVL